jgi:hypothetical protein
MFILTNKELRHLRGIIGNFTRSYPYAVEECLQNRPKGCAQCRAVKAARDYLETLKPNG